MDAQLALILMQTLLNFMQILMYFHTILITRISFITEKRDENNIVVPM